MRPEIHEEKDNRTEFELTTGSDFFADSLHIVKIDSEKVLTDEALRPTQEPTFYVPDCKDNQYWKKRETDQIGYATGRDAFLDFIYNEDLTQRAFVTPAWKKFALGVIEEISLAEDKYKVFFCGEDRFRLQQMGRGKQMQPIDFHVSYRDDRAALGDILKVASDQGKINPHASNYEEISNLVKGLGIRVPKQGYYTFSGADDMCNWILREIFRSKKYVRMCPVCKRIFFGRKNQISCSSACKKIKNDMYLFSGDKKLAKQNSLLDSMFQSKCRSVQVFKMPPEHFDGATEFRALCEQSGIKMDGLLFPENFRDIWSAYHRALNIKCIELQNVKSQIMRGEIQGKETAKVGNTGDLEQWMQKLHSQMHLLSYAEQYKTDSEAVDAEEYTAKKRKELVSRKRKSND